MQERKCCSGSDQLLDFQGPQNLGIKKRLIKIFTFYPIIQYLATLSDKNLGPYSQNFFRQIVKIFITLGLHILRLYRPKAFFQSKYQ